MPSIATTIPAQSCTFAGDSLFKLIYLFIYLFILRTYVHGHHRMRWLNKHFVFILEKLAGKLQIHVHGCESFAIYLKAAYRLFCSLLSQIYLKIVCPNKCMR